MTHQTAKANLEKGSSWRPEAILYDLRSPAQGGLLDRTLMGRTHTLDLTPDAPRPKVHVAIQLSMIKDTVLDCN